MVFEEIMNEFIILLKPSPCMLNSLLLNAQVYRVDPVNLRPKIILLCSFGVLSLQSFYPEHVEGQPFYPELVENPELVEVAEGQSSAYLLLVSIKWLQSP